MKRTVMVLCTAAILVAAGVLLSASSLQVPSGTWIAVGPMNSARSGTSAVLLQDGRILVTGGNDTNGPSTTAEFFGANGSFSMATPMNVARSGHVAIVLQDGRVLVVGGTTSGGGVTNSAEIYDPTASSWTNVAGGIVEARSGFTATLLKDGRVLLAGGAGSSGTISLTAEIFDPIAQTFTLSGQLSSARKSHAAALLSDGRVLIVGGSDGTNPLSTSDICDPATGTISAGPKLSVARQSLSATTLLDGRVLVAGGNNLVVNQDGSRSPVDLASAEILDASSTAFSTAASALVTARSGHQAFLLPHNNSVLIVGGTSNGTAIAQSELYIPWGGTSQAGIFQATGLMTTPRSIATGSALQQDGMLLVAGGNDASTPANTLSSAELYGFATIKTDVADYPPGTTVNMSGSGWQPGEAVTLTLVESPLIDTHGPYTVTADSNGNFSDSSFVTDSHDLNVSFSLTAVGSVSQAQTTFTDSITLDSVTVGSQTGALTFGTASSATFAICVNYHGNNSTISFSVISGLPSGVTASFSANNIHDPVKCPTTATTLTLTTTAAAAAGSYTFTVQANGGGTATGTGTLTINQAGQTISVTTHAPASAAYNSNFPVAATASSGLTVAITTTGGCSGSGSGSATITMTSSTTACVVHYNQAGSSNYNAAPEVTESATAQKATPTITWANPADIIYGTALSGTQLNATASVGGIFIYTPASGTVLAFGSNQNLHVDFTPTDTTNYNSTSKDVKINVNKAALTVTADAKSKSYGDADPALTYQITSGSLVSGDSFSGALTRAVGESVGTYAIQQGTLALSANYNLTYVGANLSITARPITVTADGQTKVYGNSDPTLTYKITSGSLVFSDAFTGALTRAVGESVGTYAIQQGTLALSANYNLTYVGANLSITARPITVTADGQTKVYGNSDPTLTYKITSGSLVFSDAFTGALTRAVGESVGTYAIQQGTLALSANYNLTYVGANLSITARPITVTADGQTKVYGNSDPTLTYKITSGSLVFSDAFTGALTRAVGESVGTYAIQQGTLALSANYNLTYVGANLSITARPITVTADGQTKVYGNSDPTLTYKITSGSLVFSDAFTGALTRAVGESVGTYAIQQGTLALSANYNLTYVGANLSITARPITVTADGQTKVYGNSDPTLTYKITSGSLVFSDAFTGALTRAVGESVGTYAIQQGTLALSANYNLTYVGANLSITARPITVTADGQTKVYGNSDPTLTYKITSGSLVFSDAFTGALTRAVGESVGTYAIQQGTLALSANYDLTYVGANLSITARPITVTADGQTKVYGNSDPTLTYKITSGSLVFSDAFTGALTRAVGESVGTYAIQQGTLALSANYNLTYVGANLSITARPITVTADGQTKVYGNSDPTLTYKITSGSLVFSDAFTGALTRAVGESVGTYAIQQGTLALSANYNLTYVGANLSITARPITVTADGQTKVYGNSDPTLTYKITSGSLVFSDAFTGALTRAVGESVGTYAIQQGTLALSANYNLTYVGANLSITARPITVTADGQTKVYGNSDPTLTYKITSGSLVFSDAFTGALTRAVGESVGTYAIQQGTLALSANYDLTYVGANLSITARPITVTADGQTKVYGNSDPTLTYKITSGSLVFSDAFTGALTRAVGESVGTYAIQQGTLALSANYNLTYVGANLSITARPITVTADGQTKVYGNSDPTLTYKITSGSLVFSDAFTGALTRAVGESVGTYAIQQGTLALSANYNLTYVGANLSITARPITVTADGQTKVYGNSDPTLTYKITSGSLVFSDAFTGALTRAVGESVGTYAIQQGTLALSANYDLTYVGANLSITARPITVTADGQTKVYGNSDPTLTYKITSGSLVFSDAFTGALTRAVGESVGTYAIQQGTLALSANYNLTYVGANLSITARPITVTADGQTKVYGNSDPTLTYKITSGSLVFSDAFTGALTRAVGESVGTYAIQQGTLALSANYNLTYVGANLSITARPITVTADGQTKVYGNSDPTLTYKITSGSLVFSDAFTGALTRAVGESVGTYAIQQGTLALSANYNLTYVGANLSITARPITVTADGQTKVYGNSDPTLTYKITSGSLVFSDAFTGALTRAVGESVGTYAIQQGTLALSANYNLTYVGASFSITRAMTTTSITMSTPNPSVYDQAITISALVSNASTSPTINEGMVAFTADSAMTPLCTTGTVVGGSASCTTGSLSLAVGTHYITATYVPGADFFGSGSAQFDQITYARHTNVTITSTEISNFATGSVAIDTTVHLQVTVTDDDANGTPITPTGTFTITSLIASDTFNPSDGSGNGLCTLSGSGASATCSLTVTPVEADLHEFTSSYPGDLYHLTSSQIADMTVTAPLESQKVCLDAPFNGTAVPAGSSVWFNAVFQTTGQKITTLTHLTFYKQTIQIGSSTPMPVPDGVITFDPNATWASTTFDPVDNRWNTILPTYNLAGKNWLSGMPVRFSSGLAGSTAPVTWCGQFASDSSTISLGWQWAAAVYSSNSNFINFIYYDPSNPTYVSGADLNGVGVKAVDDNKADVNYKNSDHAGTPENYLQYVIGGARGGGGNNFTGGYSGSGKLK